MKQHLNKWLRGHALLAALLLMFTATSALPPVLFIPGFMSSQLVAWRDVECPKMNIRTGDRVWIDVVHVLLENLRHECFTKCLKLNTTSQQDPPDCKLRAADGLLSVSELDPGGVTGGLTRVWRPLLMHLVSTFDDVRGGYSPTTLQAAPYDWRLPPLKLEQRDRYFSNLRQQIERIVSSANEGEVPQPAVVVAHSLGNNVFLYFVEWLRAQADLQGEAYDAWMSRHIDGYFAMGAPHTGTPGTLSYLLSGETFGMPIPDELSRQYLSTFGSSLWTIPLQEHGGPTPTRIASGFNLPPLQVMRFNASHEVPDDVWSHSEDHLIDARHCVGELETAEFLENCYRDSRRAEHFPEVFDEECFQRGDGLHALGLDDLAVMRERFYFGDMAFNAITEPSLRPPVRTVLAMYGVELPTDLAFSYSEVPPRASSPGKRFMRSEVYVEGERGAVFVESRSKRRRPAGSNGYGRCGDGTVPYASLSHSHTWFVDADTDESVIGGPGCTSPEFDPLPLWDARNEALRIVNGTFATEHTPPVCISVVEELVTYSGSRVGLLRELLGMPSETTPGYTTFQQRYEARVSGGVQKRSTTIVEMEKVLHRDIIAERRALQMMSDAIKGIDSAFWERRAE